MNDGWIKLHRSFLDWEWYTCPNTSRLFIHCLLKANHKDGKHQGEPVPRGTFLTSLELLSQQTGLTVKCIRTSLKHLEETGEVGTERARKGTRLSICKYDTYQSLDLVKGREKANEGQAKGTEGATNKKEKNLKNEEEKSIFDYFRRGYKNLGGTVRGNETEFSNFIKKHKDWKEVLPDLDPLLMCIANQKQALRIAGKFVPEWKNLSTWINQRCWEDEQVSPEPKTMTNSERVAFILANEDRGNN